MEKVTHCIDPCMKYCQGCEYGHVTVIDDGAFGETLETFCIWGLEDDPPTEEEKREYARWYFEHEPGTDADLGNHAIDVQNDMGYYDDITGRYVPYTFPNDEY